MNSPEILKETQRSPRSRLHRIVRFAARNFHVPIAIVTALDGDRPTLRASFGEALVESPGDFSFFAETLRARGALIVKDTGADKKFRDHPWVRGEPGIRFYAGCALPAPGGACWALALLDRQPRPFAAEDLASLGDFADLMKEELEAEAEAAAAATTERRLRLLLAFGPGIIYSLDCREFRVTFISDNVAKILGYAPSQILTSGFWLSHLHPDDLPLADAAFAALEETGHHEYEYRFLHVDGTYHWMVDEMNLVVGTDGEPAEIFGVWLDRTQHHRAEEELRTAREKEKRILAASSAMIFSLQFVGGHLVSLWTSDNVEKLLGYSPTERLDYLWWAQCVHPDDRLGALDSFAKSMGDGACMQEYRFRHKDGTYRWLREETRVVEQSETAMELIGSWWDVTAWKAAEEAKLSAEIGFRAVFESVLDGIIVIDGQGRFVEMNPAARRFFEDDGPDGLLGRSHPELLEDPDEMRRMSHRLRQDGTTRGEIRIRRRRGDVRDVEFYAVADYLPGRHLWVLRDVTDRLQARLAEARLARVLDSSPIVVAILSLDLTLIYVNAPARKLLGVAEGDDVAGLGLMDFPTARAARLVLSAGIRTALDSGVWNGESVLVASDGTALPYLLLIFVHPGARPEEQLLSILARDISQLKKVESELRRARDEAERANRAKTEFLSQMSHELRTPLSSILGFSEMLADRTFGEINDRQEQSLRQILASSEHLLSLINDLLDLVKIEAGRVELELVDAELGPLIADTVQAVHALADQAGLTLTLESLPLYPKVAVDLRRFKQMLLNLLSNAIKFTPRGGTVRVVAEIRESIPRAGDPIGPWLCVLVIDSGVGIQPADQERLFRPFEQILNPRRGFQPGTGLGLALTQKLCLQHHGEVWGESAGEGKGSTFILALPLSTASQPAPGADHRLGGSAAS